MNSSERSGFIETSRTNMTASELRNMENPISITWINDFLFCPVSIYFHGMYDGVDPMLYKEDAQLRGSYAHRSIDEGTSYDDDIISGIYVSSERYDLIGRIDRFRASTGTLVEAKRHIEKIHEGYVMQLYAQCFCMEESGYDVHGLALYDIERKKSHPVAMPCDDPEMLERFESTLQTMRFFDVGSFDDVDASKCAGCIYKEICAFSVGSNGERDVGSLPFDHESR